MEFQNRGFTDLDFKIVDPSDMDKDPRILEIYYSSIIPSENTYILPKVQIEIGC